jgi:hypothetical protein
VFSGIGIKSNLLKLQIHVKLSSLLKNNADSFGGQSYWGFLTTILDAHVPLFQRMIDWQLKHLSYQTL